MRRTPIIVTATVLLAGCGGSGGRSGGGSFSPEATTNCLTSNGIQVAKYRHELDPVAQDALAGATKAQVADNSVTIAFERTAKEAKRTESYYRSGYSFRPRSSLDTLSRIGNAVIVWDKTPTDSQRSTVEDCLK